MQYNTSETNEKKGFQYGILRFIEQQGKWSLIWKNYYNAYYYKITFCKSLDKLNQLEYEVSGIFKTLKEQSDYVYHDKKTIKDHDELQKYVVTRRSQIKNN